MTIFFIATVTFLKTIFSNTAFLKNILKDHVYEHTGELYLDECPCNLCSATCVQPTY